MLGISRQHTKVEQCSGVAANERGEGGTAHDHDQCGTWRNTANNAPPARTPRLTLGVSVDADN
jgi:hypothetical protein